MRDPDPKGRDLVAVEIESGRGAAHSAAGVTGVDSQPGTRQEATPRAPPQPSPAPNFIQSVSSAD